MIGKHDGRIRSPLFLALWLAAGALAVSNCIPRSEEHEEGAEAHDSAEVANPLAAFALPTADRVRFAGRVVDRLVAGSYTYLEVERPDGGRAWVVTLSSSDGAKDGIDEVGIVAVAHARHFASKRLGRQFDDLYFAVVRPK